MAEPNYPDKEGYVVVIETNFDGCTDPKGEGGGKASHSTDNDSWDSSRSSCSNESIGDPNVAARFQRSGSSASDGAEDPLPPEYCCSETYTHSPNGGPGRKRRKMRATAGIETPPSSPIIYPDDGRNEINQSNQRPRTDDNTLDIDNLKALFPHMTQDEIEKSIPTCEHYRDQAYYLSNDSDEIENEIDDQQHASDAEYR